jgi:hypothetical protein
MHATSKPWSPLDSSQISRDAGGAEPFQRRLSETENSKRSRFPTGHLSFDSWLRNEPSPELTVGFDGLPRRWVIEKDARLAQSQSSPRQGLRRLCCRRQSPALHLVHMLCLNACLTQPSNHN